MKSIKLKLLVAILLILSIFVGGVITYGMSFKGYYQKQKFSEMKHIIDEVLDMTEANGIDDKLIEEIELISAENNIQFEILDSISGKIIFATHKFGKNNMMSGGGHNRFEQVKIISSEGGITNLLVYDKATGIDFLSADKATNDDIYHLTIRAPITEIDDAVSKSMELLTIILFPIIIVVIIVTIIFSKTFTQPIIQITKKTSKIEGLDFTEPLNIKHKDEIGKLAKSVNNLSSTIENTLEDLKDKNESLEQYIQNERENEIIRREFVSSVSHELKSPIAVISGYTQALQSGMLTTEEDRDYYIAVINEEADRMQVIVNDLLDLYKLESNTFKLDIKEVNLGALVRKILKKNALSFKNLEIDLDVNINDITIMGDEIRLEQAIQNYINNAMSHVDEKKSIIIRVESSGEVIVFNSGKNIEDENLDKIWQGFVRVDKVRNYKEKRVGLGLAIVNQIIKLHKGTCGVRNVEGGVAFWIKI